MAAFFSMLLNAFNCKTSLNALFLKISTLNNCLSSIAFCQPKTEEKKRHLNCNKNCFSYSYIHIYRNNNKLNIIAATNNVMWSNLHDVIDNREHFCNTIDINVFVINTNYYEDEKKEFKKLDKQRWMTEEERI